MDFGFEVISAEEFERQHALYGPMTELLRKLVAAGIRTEVDEATIRDAQAAIETATEMLERKQRTVTSILRHEGTGRPLAFADPAIGLCNAIAPPMIVHHDADGRAWSEFSLGGAYEGPRGRVHGGICALVLDHILGEAASDGLTQPKFTGTMTLRYLRATPLGPLRAEAFVEATEGVKTFVRGYLSDAEGTTVEAEGVFITPAWARDAE